MGHPRAAVTLASGQFIYDWKPHAPGDGGRPGVVTDVAGANSVAAMAFGDVAAAKEILSDSR